MSAQPIKPRLIVVAGPNGAGKTSITEQLLRHEWMGEFYLRASIIPAPSANRGESRVCSRFPHQIARPQP